MSAIDTQNAKSIRDTMQIIVNVGETNDPIFTFTNENLISCELNLRSDLKPIDPTLPESEIVITAYWPEDITEMALTIKEDTVITYRAGYEGDMSPIRKFYLSERIEWSENVITVKGVDAVHFLDGNTPPMFIGTMYADRINDYDEKWHTNYDAFGSIYTFFRRIIEDGGISFTSAATIPYRYASSQIDASYISAAIERQPRRDVIANMMNLCHQDYDSGYFSGIGNTFWLSYIDAGRPVLKVDKPSSTHDVYEVDCGNIKKHLDDPIVEINASNKRLNISPYRSTSARADTPYIFNQDVGSSEIFNGSGAGLKYDVLTSIFEFVVKRDTVPSGVSAHKYYCATEGHPDAQSHVDPEFIEGNQSSGSSRIWGFILRDDEDAAWQSWSTTSSNPTTRALSWYWSQLNTYGYIDSGKTTVTTDLCGGAYNLTDNSKKYTKTGDGVSVSPSKTKWCGSISAGKSGDASTILNILPDNGFRSLMNRSNETGSFTWKGDPRMQPRDVFTFHYIDGTTELRTIESINLKHEGGGTVAQITYRKGIV